MDNCDDGIFAPLSVSRKPGSAFATTLNAQPEGPNGRYGPTSQRLSNWQRSAGAPTGRAAVTNASATTNALAATISRDGQFGNRRFSLAARQNPRSSIRSRPLDGSPRAKIPADAWGREREKSVLRSGVSNRGTDESASGRAARAVCHLSHLIRAAEWLRTLAAAGVL
jgi:hypothetical protein